MSVFVKSQFKGKKFNVFCKGINAALRIKGYRDKGVKLNKKKSNQALN